MSSYVARGWAGNPADITAYKATLEAAAIAARVGFWFWPAVTLPPKVPAGQGGSPAFICCLPANWTPPAAPAGVAALPNEAAALALTTALQ